MRRKNILLLTAALPTTLCLLLALAYPARAQWPTTIEDYLIVAGDSVLFEGYPSIIPYSENRMLVVYQKEGTEGNCYQIIDRFGYFAFPEPQLLAPMADLVQYEATVIPDGVGGALAAWKAGYFLQEQGFYAQRLDGQGNRQWGDSAVTILRGYIDPSSGNCLDVCIDGAGGYFVAFAYMPPGASQGVINIQHLDGDGQFLWGDSGIAVSPGLDAQYNPKIVADFQGGVYLVWKDVSPPYWPYGVYRRQRFDPNGQPMWTPATGIYTCQPVWHHFLTSDDANGFIMLANPGPQDYFTAFRYGPTGEELWSVSHVSWWDNSKLLKGEPGFFYIGFTDPFAAVYGQRMDMQGNVYWPTWGSGQLGAIMADFDQGFGQNETPDFAYHLPYFYGIYSFRQDSPAHGPVTLWVNALDLGGNPVYGDSGVMLGINEETYAFFKNRKLAVDDDGAMVAAWEHEYNAVHNVYAKRCNADGSLGGPPLAVPPVEAHEGELRLGVQGAMIQFSLPVASEVLLELFDITGRRVALLHDGYQLPGIYTVRFDHLKLSSGIYLLHLSSRFGQQAQKVVIVR